MLKSLSDLLAKSMLRPAHRTAIAAALLLEEADKALAELWPDRAATMKAKSFKDGLLKIACQRSVFAEDLRLRADDVVAAVNARLGGGDTVKKLIVE